LNKADADFHISFAFPVIQFVVHLCCDVLSRRSKLFLYIRLLQPFESALRKHSASAAPIPTFPCLRPLRVLAQLDFMRKQLDSRIPVLINNNVKANHRSFIVLVGDKGRDQVGVNPRNARHVSHVSIGCESPLPAFPSPGVCKTISTMVL
jgi:hypothetical protein